MRRRDVLTLVGGAAGWPLAARAQQPALPVVGWLSSRDAATDELVLPAVRRALAAQGYVEGQNVTVEYRFAAGQPERLESLAAEIARSRVAVVIAVGDAPPVTRALQTAGATMPIVFITATDPVEEGFVPNLNR